MNKLYEEIINYYSRHKNITTNQARELSQYSVYLSIMIAFYTHKDQIRLNEEYYYFHPIRCLELYQDLIGINNNPDSIDLDKLDELELPYRGVQELCCLHDVIEDTQLTINDIESLFKEVNLLTYFQVNIKAPLLLLTHNKSESYDEYISKLIINPTASLVKVIDMYNNLNALTYGEINDKNLDNFNKYMKFISVICIIHKFPDKFKEYNKCRKENNMMNNL